MSRKTNPAEVFFGFIILLYMLGQFGKSTPYSPSINWGRVFIASLVGFGLVMAYASNFGT